eukprot:1883313-Prymnesium_polylepis.2
MRTSELRGSARAARQGCCRRRLWRKPGRRSPAKRAQPRGARMCVGCAGGQGPAGVGSGRVKGLGERVGGEVPHAYGAADAGCGRVRHVAVLQLHNEGSTGGGSGVNHTAVRLRVRLPSAHSHTGRTRATGAPADRGRLW